MLSNGALIKAWGGRCTGRRAMVTLNGGGRVQIQTAAVPAVLALDTVLRHHGYKTRPADTGGFSCRKIAGTNVWSIHAYALAIDINWQTNPHRRPLKTDMPAGMIADIERLKTRNGVRVWRWGGRFSKPDTMHYELCCSPRDLATGIDPRTLPTSSPAPTPTPTPTPSTEEEMYVRINENGAIFSVTQETIRHLGPEVWAARQFFGAVAKPQAAADFMKFVHVNKLIELPATA